MHLYKINRGLFLPFLLVSGLTFGQRVRQEKPLAIIHFGFDGSQLMIPVTLNHGKDTLHFLFDSGCEINLLSLPVASRLGLKGTTDAGLSGWSNKMVVMPETESNSMEIGSVTIPYPHFYLYGLPRTTADGYAVDGVLGYDLLKRYIVKIDFQTKEMFLYRSGDFRYPPGGDLFPIDMNFDTPTIGASLINNQGQTYTSTYHIITGGNFGLLLNRKYVEKNSLDQSLSVTGKVTRQDLIQPIIYTQFVIPGFRIGNYRFPQVEGLSSPMVNDTSGKKEIAGAIGAEVWKHFIMVINLPAKKLYLIREK